MEHCTDCKGKGIIAVPCEKCIGRGLAYHSREQLSCDGCDGLGHFLYICLKCEGTGICEKEPAADTL